MKDRHSFTWQSTTPITLQECKTRLPGERMPMIKNLLTWRTGGLAVVLAMLLIGACADVRESTPPSLSRFPGSGPPADRDLTHDHLSVDSIVGEVVLDSSRSGYPRDLAVTGKYLFLLETSPPPLLRIFDLDSWAQTTQAGRAGEGPGEVRRPFELVLSPNGDPWIFDPTVRRLIRLHRVARGDGSETLVADTQTISLTAGTMVSLAWITDSTLVGVGLLRTERFGLIDRAGKLIREVGGVPDGDSAVPVQFRNLYHEGRIAVHPSGRMFAIARANTAELQIYSVGGALHANGAVPFEFESSFSLELTSQGGGGIGWDETRRKAYVDVAATDERIYALFSGRTIQQYGGNGYGGARYVHEYDWDGMFIREIWLDGHDDAARIAVDPDGSYLYVLHRADVPAVSRFPLRAPSAE